MLRTLALVLFFSSFLAACSNLKKMLPEKATVKEDEYQSLEEIPRNQINYGELKFGTPIIPFQIFGVTYEQDIVIVTNHPLWDMHEISRIDLPDGSSTWIIKDSKNPYLDQYLITDRADLAEFLPEIPLNKSISEIEITDQSDEKFIEMDFKYTNSEGEKVLAHFFGKRKMPKLKKRNGSTMGHSQRQVLALLDMPARGFGKYAYMTYDDREYKLKKLLGIKPFNMLLTQTQGGISKASYSLMESMIGLSMVGPDNSYQMDWEIVDNEYEVQMKNQNSYREQVYSFEKDGENLLLKQAYTQSWNDSIPTFTMNFYPALPDLRYKFEGTIQCQFVMDVNDQRGHAIGEVRCSWIEDSKIKVEIDPQRPWWVYERPVTSIIELVNKDQLQVETTIGKRDWKNRKGK